MLRGRALRASLAALATSLSCGPGDQSVEIDPAFTSAQQADIRRAADAWNAFTSRKITIDADGDWLVVSANVPGGWLGYTQRHRHLTRISPLTPDDQIYAVALHEFGHVLGLRHVKNGVMRADRQVTEFSEDDFAECRNAGAC
jgi:hypothetical protein